MKKSILTLCVFLICMAAGAIHIGYLMPSGGQQGTEVEVIVGGQGLGGLKGALVTGNGITVESVKAVRGFPHPSGPQRKYLMQWLDGIRKGNPEKPPLPEKTEGWRSHPYWERLDRLTETERELTLRFLYLPRNRLQMSPAIASTAIVRLKIAHDAAPGEREFRLLSPGGVSNPLRFFVDTLNERREPWFALPPDQNGPGVLNVPGIVNGQILPGETDRYRFTAKKGEEITFTMTARYLMPFIGDGVPGYFQGILEVADQKGRPLVCADDNYFDPDPVLHFRVPEDGEYTLLVRDALYRGREDFVYRIRAVHGRPVRRVIAPPPEFPAMKVTDEADIRRPLAVPSMVRGVLKNRNVRSSFPFLAKKGERIILEVFARRLYSPLDSLLQVYDSDGKLLCANDDCKRLKAGLILHRSADSFLDFTAPEDGTYTAVISDVTGKGGPDHGYFLRIDRPRPRFTLYTIPSAVRVPVNGSVPLTVVAERFDGFRGEIKLKLETPGDFTITGIDSIPAGCDRAVITIGTRTARNMQKPFSARLTGTSGGFSAVAVPGDEAMQAFAYTHIVPAQQMILTKTWIGGADKFSLVHTPCMPWAVDQPHAAFPAAQENGRLPEQKFIMNVDRRGFPANAEAELVLVDPPEWLEIQPSPLSKTKPGQIVPQKPKETPDPYQLVLMLARKPDGAGKSINQLFKVIYKYDSKPDKEGKIRRITSHIILPAIRIEGGN